jgi:hypothetical protein
MTYYDSNELRAFPLVGNDDGAIAQDLIVDTIIQAPASYGDQLTLISMSVTDLVVSCVLAIDGQPAAYLTTLQSALTTHAPIAVTPILFGVTGFMAFGEGVRRQRLRVDGSYEFLPEALLSYQDSLATATMRVGPHSLIGLVRLEAGTGLEIVPETLRIKREDDEIVTVTAGVVRAIDAAIAVDPIPGCLRPAEGDPKVRPITSINGVVPDCDGNLDLEIVNVREIPTDPGIVEISTDEGDVWTDEGEPCGS